MRIGIHTGQVVGGIVGSKQVRYDIFGEDVLIANKMESNGLAGKIVISEVTHDLLKHNMGIYDTLDFKEYQDVQISELNQNIKAFTVEPIY